MELTTENIAYKFRIGIDRNSVAHRAGLGAMASLFSQGLYKEGLDEYERVAKLVKDGLPPLFDELQQAIVRGNEDPVSFSD